MKRRITPEVIRFAGEAANAYLLQHPEGYTAVDVGSPKVARRMVNYLADVGRRPHDISLAVATHLHADHIGGLADLQRLTGCKIYAHRQGRKAHGAKAAEPAWGRLLGKRFGIAARPRWPFRIAGWLENGSTLPGGWQVIYTPGHTPESICLYHAKKKLLVAGDTLVSRSDLLHVNASNADEEAVDISIRTLESLRVRVVYPGHGNPALGETVFQKALRRQPSAHLARMLARR
jgi:hydroxyacylglutathione hydrolase